MLNKVKVGTVKKVLFFGMESKTEKATKNQLKVIKNNPYLVHQKMPFLKQSNDNKFNPNYFFLLAALFLGITILILPY